MNKDTKQICGSVFLGNLFLVAVICAGIGTILWAQFILTNNWFVFALGFVFMIAGYYFSTLMKKYSYLLDDKIKEKHK